MSVCTICGGEFMYGGGDRHASCRELVRKSEERDARIDEMLEWFEFMKTKQMERDDH